MALKKNKIKSAIDIQSSIRRIAYQLYETNIDETTLVLVGIEKKGAYLSKLIGLELNYSKMQCNIDQRYRNDNFTQFVNL